MRGNKQRKMCSISSSNELGTLIPGLPNEHALECLARVALPSNLWGVCKNWQQLLQSDGYFRSKRRELGHVDSPQWLYVLVSSPSSQQRTSPGSSPLLDSSSSRTEWYAYDPLGEQWHLIPEMPIEGEFQLSIPCFVGHSHSIQSTSTGHQLIVVAGTRSCEGRLEPALAAPLVFDSRTSTWSRAPPLAVPRRWCASGATCGRLLVASGCGREWDSSVARAGHVWNIDGGGGGWKELPPLATSKLSAEATAAVALGGKLYVVSGRGVFVKVGVVLDVAAGEWSDMPRGMRSGWCGPSVAACGKIFVVEDLAGRLKYYDAEADSWHVVLVDSRLRGLCRVVAASGGMGTKICGDAGSGVIRVIDLAGDTARIFEIAPPPEAAAPGSQIVEMQLLSGVLL